MAIRNVVTRGYGAGATVGFVVTRGYGDPSAASAAISGTTSLTEAQIVAGGETIVITLTNDTWVASGATFDAQRQNIIDGLDSAQSEATGWNAEVRDNEVVTAVVRTSNTIVTITLSAAAAYDVTADEVITVTVPATALTGAAELTGSPTIAVTADADVITQPSGGFMMAGVFDDFSSRKRRKLKKIQDAVEEVKELQGVDGEIAVLLQEKEKQRALTDSVNELERLIVESFSDRELEAAKAHNERVAVAFARAATQKNFSAIMAFEREMERSREEDEFLLLAMAMLS